MKWLDNKLNCSRIVVSITLRYKSVLQKYYKPLKETLRHRTLTWLLKHDKFCTLCYIVTYHVRIFIWISNTNVSQFDVQELIHWMKCSMNTGSNIHKHILSIIWIHVINNLQYYWKTGGPSLSKQFTAYIWFQLSKQLFL